MEVRARLALGAPVRRVVVSETGETRHERLERLYDEASKLSPEERGAFLDVACEGDQGLKGEVEELVSFESKLDSFGQRALLGHMDGLESNAPTEAPFDRDAKAASQEWMPERIGSYAVKRLIARGTTGVVFEAMQAFPRRRVALKLIHPLVATETALGRLRREAELLGRLHHPGIAQVFEAGFDEAKGQLHPFFAMEYIEGESLLSYAADVNLDQRSKLKLLLSVCEAIQHAHDEGVVHRDLKPDNILVDRHGQPKLLDFGVARVLESEDAKGTLQTQSGELLGTLAYMAPEQASGNPTQVTPATDVFAVGVIAYQLLSGELPRQLHGLPVTQALDVVARTDAPPLRDSYREASRDLETVVGKALATEPVRRYPSALALADDLRNVLEGRPISAKPVGAVERLGKYLRRNRLLVFSAAAISASLAVGLVAAIGKAREEADFRRATLRDLYASEMLRATDMSSRATGRVDLDETLTRWVPGAGGEDQRGWEWRHLAGIRERPSVALPLSNYGMDIDWHPSGDSVVVASVSVLEVFDVETAERIAVLPPVGGGGHFLASNRFSPDGERILFCGWNVIGIWNPGAQQLDWMHEGVAHRGCAWSPDGDSVMATDEEKRHLVRYDAATGAELQRLPEAGPIIGFRDLSPDGRYTTTLSRESQPIILDLETGASQPPLREVDQVPMCLAFDPTGTRLAESGWSHLIRLYSLADPSEVIEIDDHNEQVDSVAWHPTDPLIATGAGDSSVRIYGSQRGTLMEVLRGHTDRVRAVRWSPDGTKLASSSDDRVARIWDPSSRAAYRRRTARKNGSPYFSVTIEALHGTDDIRVSHLNGSFTIAMPGAEITDEGRGGRSQETTSPDGRLNTFVRRRDVGFEVVAVEASTGKEIWSREYEVNEPTVRSWHPTETKFFVGATDGFELVDLEATPTSVWTIPAMSVVRGGSFDPSGAHVVLIENQQPVRVIATATGEPTATIALPENIEAFAAEFSPGGESLAIACSDGHVRVHHPQTGELDEVLKGHAGKVYCVGWHPIEPRAATGSADGTVMLWNTDTFAATARFECEETVKALTWANDGELLVAITAKGLIHLWEAAGEPTVEFDSSEERSSSR